MQKKPYPKLFKAVNNPDKVVSYVIVSVWPLIMIVAVPHDIDSVVISHEYFVVAFMEYSLFTNISRL